MNASKLGAHVLFAVVATAAMLAAGCAGSSNAIPGPGAAGGTAQNAVAGTLSRPNAVGPQSPTPSPSPVPSSTPQGVACPSGYTCGYVPITSLSFNGSTFSEIPSAWPCFPNLWDTPVYTAVTNGPLELTGGPTLASTCSQIASDQRVHDVARGRSPFLARPVAPNAVPTPGGNATLYIVAYQVGWSNWDRQNHNAHKVKPDCASLQPLVIAGPAIATNPSWFFTPLPDAYNLQANASYIFFIADRFQIKNSGWW
jgi:hypothetical protein